MKSFPRQSVLPIVLALGVILMAACARAPQPSQQGKPPSAPAPSSGPAPSAAPPKVTRLLVASGRDYGQGVWMAVALEKGYFTEEGLEIEWKTFGSGAEASQAVGGGTAAIGLMGETPAIALRAGGVPVVLLSRIVDYTDSTQLWIGNEIRVDKPEDLHGLRIAIQSGSSGDAMLSQLQKVYKINRSKVTLVNLSPPDAVTAYGEKQVDGGIFWEPWIAAAKEKRPTKVLHTGRTSFFPSNSGKEVLVAPSYGVIIAQEKFVRENPSATRGFLRALVKAEKFIAENKEQSIDIFATKVNQKRELAASSANTAPVGLALDPALEQGFSLLGEYLVTVGRITKYPPLKDWLYEEPLKELHPRAVKIEGTWKP